jgi:hypothetical protein
MLAKLYVQLLDLEDTFGFNPFGRFNTGPDPESSLLTSVRVVLIIVLIVLFLIWVVTAALIGVKFITSLGNPEKVGNAALSLRNFLVGVTLTFLVVLGLLVIANFFNV